LYENFWIDIQCLIAVREQTYTAQLWWWRWWTSDDVTISYLVTARLRVCVSMCNRCMHYLIRRVSNKLLPSFLFGWVTLIHWTGTDETSLSVCVCRVVILSFHISFLSLFIYKNRLFRHHWTWEILRLLLHCLPIKQKHVRIRNVLYYVYSLVIEQFIDWLVYMICRIKNNR
jgi:hypothetical protein